MSFPVFSQENAFDYMVPICNSERQFYKVENNSLKGELTELDLSSSGFTRTVVSQYRQDGTVGYKFIHHTEGLFSDEDYAYFVSFSSNTASMYGHSKFLLGGEYTFLQYVNNEQYKDLNSTVFCKVPISLWTGLIPIPKLERLLAPVLIIKL